MTKTRRQEEWRWRSAGLRGAIMLALGVALLTGCGVSTSASHRTISPDHPPRKGQASGQRTPATLVYGNFNTFARVTARNIAVWLGDAASTKATAQALLAGWNVSGSAARRGSSRLVLAGTSRLVEEAAPTPAQQKLLSADGAGLGPITLVLQQVHSRSLSRAVESLIQEVSAPGGMPGAYYGEMPLHPGPSTYFAPEGGPSIDPTAPLTGKGYTCPAQGTVELMGIEGGYIVPVAVTTVDQGAQFAWGFAPGMVVTYWNNNGVEGVLWYHVPGIAAPSPQ